MNEIGLEDFHDDDIDETLDLDLEEFTGKEASQGIIKHLIKQMCLLLR